MSENPNPEAPTVLPPPMAVVPEAEDSFSRRRMELLSKKSSRGRNDETQNQESGDDTT